MLKFKTPAGRIVWHDKNPKTLFTLVFYKDFGAMHLLIGSSNFFVIAKSKRL